MKNSENKIEEIRTSNETNKSQAYLTACDGMEKQVTEILREKKELGFICKKFAEEVSLNYKKAQSADCEYAVYAAAHSAASYMDMFIQHSSKY